MKDLQNVIPALHRLNEIGVEIAIDDFGTGYSSLAYLTTLPISELKIDRSFVRDLGVTPQSSAVVTAIIALARSLGLRVIAEGVETLRQMEVLHRLGCSRDAGLPVQPPGPADDLERWLEQTVLPRKAPWIGQARRLATAQAGTHPRELRPRLCGRGWDRRPAVLPERARVLLDRLVGPGDRRCRPVARNWSAPSCRPDGTWWQQALDRSAQSASAQSQAWAMMLERLLRVLQRGSKQWTAARKKDSLQRVLDGSRSDMQRLQQRLPTNWPPWPRRWRSAAPRRRWPMRWPMSATVCAACSACAMNWSMNCWRCAIH
jgi:hypothetical protein